MDILLYSTANCSQCSMAKMFLDMKGLTYTSKEVGVDLTLEQLKEIVPTARTFPVVFIDEVHIGGYLELKQKIK